jgi:hypothetical protein
MSLIDVTARGIPCMANVTTYRFWRGRGVYADNDIDAEDHYTFDFEIVDRRGRPAPWITDKMTDSQWADVERQIIEYFDDIKDDY